jgi:hypothetical protein
MKGAFLVGTSDHLFNTAEQVVRSLGGNVSSDGAILQLKDEVGGLITAYRVAPELEWEFKAGELKASIGADLPDVNNMHGIALECRSEFQFAALMKAIADASDGDLWVVDGDGVVWPASRVDPSRVRLLCTADAT